MKVIKRITKPFLQHVRTAASLPVVPSTPRAMSNALQRKNKRLHQMTAFQSAKDYKSKMSDSQCQVLDLPRASANVLGQKKRCPTRHFQTAKHAMKRRYGQLKMIQSGF